MLHAQALAMHLFKQKILLICGQFANFANIFPRPNLPVIQYAIVIVSVVHDLHYFTLYVMLLTWWLKANMFHKPISSDLINTFNDRYTVHSIVEVHI